MQLETNVDLESALSQLSKATGAPRARILKALGETICEKRVLGEVSRRPQYEQQFDPYYNERHEFAKRKLVRLLASELGSLGERVTVSTEVSTPIGRLDIVVANENSEIAVEIKAGLALSLSQVERYLGSGKKVVLVRIPFEQVIVFRPDDYGTYLKLVDDERLSAVKRLLSGVVQPIPGPDCLRCPVSECEYNRFKPHDDAGRVTPRDFGADLQDFSTHLYPSLEKAVRTIVRELGIPSGSSTCFSDSNFEMPESPAPSQLSGPLHSPHS